MATEQKALRLLVHKSSVGAIIGKAGTTIQKINTNSGATVGIENEYSKDRPLRENVREVVLTINFTEPKQLTAALTELAPILHESRQQALLQQREPKTIPADEHYITALIHAAGVATLLEKEGAQIKQVQEQSASLMKIRERLPQSSESSISFKGTLDQVIKGFIACLPALLDRSGEEKAAFRPYTAGIIPRQGDEIATRTFDVPATATGGLLRNAGARVKYIRKTTSCSVSVSLEEGAEKAKVTVKGPQSNLPFAVSMVRFPPTPSQQQQQQQQQQPQQQPQPLAAKQ